MPTMLEANSTLTDRYQTTVPESIRRALKLGKRDKIQYQISSDGAVTISRASTASEDDPILGQLLTFLATDLSHHPQRLQTLNSNLLARITPLIADVKFDINAPLAVADE